MAVLNDSYTAYLHSIQTTTAVKQYNKILLHQDHPAAAVTHYKWVFINYVLNITNNNTTNKAA